MSPQASYEPSLPFNQLPRQNHSSPALAIAVEEVEEAADKNIQHEEGNIAQSAVSINVSSMEKKGKERLRCIS
jgi:hypothetical protein